MSHFTMFVHSVYKPNWSYYARVRCHRPWKRNDVAMREVVYPLRPFYMRSYFGFLQISIINVIRNKYETVRINHS